MRMRSTSRRASGYPSRTSASSRASQYSIAVWVREMRSPSSVMPADSTDRLIVAANAASCCCAFSSRGRSEPVSALISCSTSSKARRSGSCEISRSTTTLPICCASLRIGRTATRSRNETPSIVSSSSSKGVPSVAPRRAAASRSSVSAGSLSTSSSARPIGSVRRRRYLRTGRLAARTIPAPSTTSAPTGISSIAAPRKRAACWTSSSKRSLVRRKRCSSTARCTSCLSSSGSQGFVTYA